MSRKRDSDRESKYIWLHTCACILKGCIKKAETASASLCNLPWCCWLYAIHLRHRQVRKLSRVWFKNQIKNHRRCYYSWKYLLKTGYERKNKASGFVSHSVVIEMTQIHGTFHSIFCFKSLRHHHASVITTFIFNRHSLTCSLGWMWRVLPLWTASFGWFLFNRLQQQVQFSLNGSKA